MKLYLSSYRVPVPDELSKLVGKSFESMRVALITNAKDYYIERARQFKTQEAVIFFEGVGVTNLDEIDLRKFDDKEELRKILKQYDLIWVNGGNTFMLRYELQRSGFDGIVEDLLEGGIVYGGESAGAIVAGTDLHGTEFADVPEFSEEIIWDGMKLVDKFILPHVDNPQYVEMVEGLTQDHGVNQTIALKDDQAYVVNGSERKIVEAQI